MVNNPFGNWFSRVQEFMQFSQQIRQANIDPQKQVQQMLDSGQITQEQLNYAMPLAQQFYSFILSFVNNLGRGL